MAARGLLSGVALLSAGLLLPSCVVDAFCFSNCGSASGGQGGAGGVGGAPFGGSGGFIPGGSGGGTPDASCDADLETDLENCGACGNKCELPGAFATCEAGRCEVESCAPQFYDLDGDPQNGCEYACAVPVIGPEICDGIDNDCDGFVDLEDVDLTPPPGLCNTTPGTPCEGTQALCLGALGWSCDYSTDVETDQGFVRSIESRCDGIDGNCDGHVDETFQDLGKPCDDGGVGVCRDSGEVACDPTDDGATFCDLSVLPDPSPPSAELCNGLDDDCDGLVDEGVVFDMQPFPSAASPSFLVDRFEASRPDATSSAAGLNEHVACTAPDVLPWTSASWSRAKAACEARGPKFRLCTAAELRQACAEGGRTFPYGMSYEPDTCNGGDHDAVPGGPVDSVLLPTGSLLECKSESDLYDLSGNAAEWTSTRTGSTNEVPPQDIYQLHGGSYLSPSLGLSCDIELSPRAGEKAILPNIGFRCCADP